MKGQNEIVFFDQLIKKDLQQIKLYFDDNVDLCIENFDKRVGKEEAMNRLGAFLNSNPPVSYTIRHKGNSMGLKSNYYVCDLLTSKNNYRMFAYFDKKNGSNKISEFRLEKN